MEFKDITNCYQIINNLFKRNSNIKLIWKRPLFTCGPSGTRLLYTSISKHDASKKPDLYVDHADWLKNQFHLLVVKRPCSSFPHVAWSRSPASIVIYRASDNIKIKDIDKEASFNVAYLKQTT